MKRPRFGSRSRLSRDVTQLCWLATGLAESGGRLEDAFWEPKLAALVDGLLESGGDEDITLALDRLYETQPRAHDELADMVESRAESCILRQESQEFDVLLIAAPILSWSRFTIPTATLPAAALATLKVHLGAHVLAAGARLALCDYLFSPDQLPRSFADTRQLVAQLGLRALAGEDLAVDTRNLPETNRFLSDTRYLLGAVVVPRGQGLFFWNENDGSREVALSQWQSQAGPTLEPLMPGCAWEMVLPDAYHAACRAADRLSRPYSLRASVAFQQTVLNAPADQLHVAMAPFHDQRLEEYRIGFSFQDRPEVVHGVVWPLLGDEDENTDVAAEIEATLKDCGVTHLVCHEHRFPFEFCEDCGAPLYPNGEGELMHAELPEGEMEQQPPRLLH